MKTNYTLQSVESLRLAAQILKTAQQTRDTYPSMKGTERVDGLATWLEKLGEGNGHRSLCEE